MQGTDHAEHENPKLRGDWYNIFLLLYMYVLQSIPRGLAFALPLILQKKNVTYEDQAGFSLSQYSYCIKVLWSPIVDSVYSETVGRRKTWMIPSQFLIGLILLLLAINLNDWLGSEDGTRKPKTLLLGTVFFLCVLFGSTQDIAVDAWALTMLKKRNIGHQATCNNVGFAIGLFLGYTLFLVLDSKDFCNFFRRIPEDHGFIQFSDFILILSIICLVSTVLIGLLKRDNSLDFMQENDECKIGLGRSYKLLWEILKLKPVQKISILMLTHHVSFGPQMGVANLKLVDAGMPADTFALLTLPSLPFVVISQFALSRYLTGHRCMRTFLLTFYIKLILNGVCAIFIFCIPYTKGDDNALASWHYCAIFLIYNIENMVDCSMWVSSGAFMSRVSDFRFGGMYMTLLNTMAHIGIRWPISLSLWLLEPLTIRTCAEDNFRNVSTCDVMFDGYYTETIICTLFGIVWVYWAKRQIYQLEQFTPSAWIVEPRKRIVKENVALTLTSSKV